MVLTMVEKYFEKYIEICKDIKEMIRELQVKKSDLYTLSGMNYEECLKSTIHTGFEESIQEIMNLEEMLKEKQKEKKELYEKYLIDLQNIINLKERKILKLFYLDMLTIKQISEIMELSDSYVKSLKSSAIDHFEKIILNSTK